MLLLRNKKKTAVGFRVNFYVKKKIFCNEATSITFNSGVYAILNKATGRVYIGSATSLKRRFYEQSSYLRTNNHWIKILQEDWNVLGSENFEFLIMEECLNFRERESFYIEKYKDIKYNINLGVTKKGTKHSKETLLKMKQGRAKQILSPDHYQKIKEKTLAKNPNFYQELALSKFKTPNIRCKETGEVFFHCMEAARKYNISRNHVWRSLHKINKKSARTYSFEYF
jgi:hypothetical protein